MYTNYYSTIPNVCSTKMNCGADFKTKLQNSVKPKMNVVQTEDKIILEFSLPGVLKENLDLQCNDQVLTLKAKRIKDENSENLKHVEFGTLNYERNLQLPDDVDTETIHGEFLNGVLNVTLRKTPKKVIQIEVK